MIPGIWLGSKIKARQKSILKTMPDALDLLTISVEAGLGFDLALQRVADKWDNDLSREFQRVISDTRLGTTRGLARHGRPLWRRRSDQFCAGDHPGRTAWRKHRQDPQGAV